MPVMLSTIAPSTAFAAPASPVRAPCGTTGTRCADATSTTATTSAVLRGRTTANGVPAGHRSAWSRRYLSSTSGSVITAWGRIVRS